MTRSRYPWHQSGVKARSGAQHNVGLTPGLTRRWARRLIEWKNVLQAPLRCANPQAWPAHLQRRKAILGF
ncbi:MAG: hypothetical protein RI949_3056 [Pseudomonadota bacterium]